MKKFFKFGDFVIILIICLISISGMFFLAESGQGEKIVVLIDGNVYAEYTTKQIKGTKDVDIKTKYGQNILRISESGAEMIFSDCSMQIDVKRGKITKPGQSIICAPHKLTVYIEGRTETDAISR